MIFKCHWLARNMLDYGQDALRVDTHANTGRAMVIATYHLLFQSFINLRSERWAITMNSRGISFVTELKTQVKHTCPDCHEYKLLVYLVLNDQGQMFGVCNECGPHFINQTKAM
jgi:hypothetical protein